MGIKFGTDGWRAVIAEDFTFANVRICAQGVADFIRASGGRGPVAIGYDTRFASEDFAVATAEVLAGNGVAVLLSDKAIPTPVVSHAVVANKAVGGVVITASHNPAQYNGFKYKSPDGASAPAEAIDAIEKHIAALGDRAPVVMPLEEAVSRGLVSRFNPDRAYAEQVGRLVDLPALRAGGLRLAVDAMFGAGSGYFRDILTGGSTTVDEINGERNPAFPGIRPEPIARNLTKLSAMVKSGGYAVGLAQDGDADRIGIVDENGVFLNQLQVFALLALYVLEVRHERRPIVKTVTSTSMLDRLGELYGVRVFETPVGFKYVAPAMLQEDAAIGGEESGGYGFRGHVPERDSIVAGLYFLDFMLRTGKTPSQLLQWLYSKVGPHYYDRDDYPTTAERQEAVVRKLNNARPSKIGGFRVVKVDTTDGFRFFLEDKSWLLVRFSGTEPLIRVYAEADSQDKIKRFLTAGRELLGV